MNPVLSIHIHVPDISLLINSLSTTIYHILWEKSEPTHEKFAYAKTKKQISCASNAQLISAFVFATHIVQSLFYLNPNFQASSFLLWLLRPVSVRPGRNHKLLVSSCSGSFKICYWLSWIFEFNLLFRCAEAMCVAHGPSYVFFCATNMKMTERFFIEFYPLCLLNYRDHQF